MLKHFLSLLCFIIFSLYITYPLVFNLNHLAKGVGDELLIAWIHNWVIHSYASGNILGIFNANLYYPFINSLAYSDTFFVSSAIALVPVFLLGEPVVAINVTLILSIIFLGFSIYLLSFYLTKDFLSSFLSGILIIFSPTVLSHATHVQMLAITGVPLSILFALLFLEKQKTNFLVLSLACFCLQTYNSFLPGYFILFSYIIIFVTYWFCQRKKILKILTKKNLLFLTIAGVLLLPIIIPYYQVSKEFNYVRDIRDSIHFALQPEDLLYSSEHSRISEFYNKLPINQFSQNNEFKTGYLGFIFSALTLLVIYYLIKFPKKRTKYTSSFSIIAITGLILSFGPVLHFGRQTIHDPFPIPLPYALFYYILPGFQGFRNSARWEMLFVLAMAVLIAIILHSIFKKQRKRVRVFVYGFLIFCIIAEFNFPMRFVEIPQRKDFPPVYSWLNTTPNDAAIIHMPIYNWGMWPYTQEELWREYYGTEHFRETVNGYTGFSPPPWQKFIAKMDEDFPKESAIKTIKDMRVDYIIVSKDLYDQGFKDKKEKVNGDFVVQTLKKNKQLRLIKQFDNYYVFTFVEK